MQSVRSRIWTRVAVSISYDDNDYTTGTIHDDIHCGVAATQKRIKLEAWWPGYSQDVEEYIKRCKKCKELRNFTRTTLHSWPREVEPSSQVDMDHTYITGVELLLIPEESFFRLAWSNSRARQEKFYDKTDSKSHILQKRHTKNPYYQTMHQNFVMKIWIYDWKKYSVNRIRHRYITLNRMGGRKEWCRP